MKHLIKFRSTLLVITALSAACNRGSNSASPPKATPAKAETAAAKSIADFSDQPQGTFVVTKTLTPDTLADAFKLDDSCYDATGDLKAPTQFDDRVHAGDVFTIESKSKNGQSGYRDTYAITVKSVDKIKSIYTKDLIGGTTFEALQPLKAVDSQDETCTLDASGFPTCSSQANSRTNLVGIPAPSTAGDSEAFCYIHMNDKNDLEFTETYEEGTYTFLDGSHPVPAYRHRSSYKGKWTCASETALAGATSTSVVITSRQIPVIEQPKCRSNGQIFSYTKVELDDGTPKQSYLTEITAISP